MAIGIADEHVQLVEVAASFMDRHGDRASARAALEAEAEELPDFWDDLRELGWLGLHLPEEYGGSGYGLAELVVVVEELGRAVAAGPFVPTRHRQRRHRRGRARRAASSGCCRGSPTAPLRRRRAREPTSTVTGSAVHGRRRGRRSAAAWPSCLVLPAGDDVVVVEASGGRRHSSTSRATSTRPGARPRSTLDGAPADVHRRRLRRLLLDLARLIFAAEAVGRRRRPAPSMAAAYAKVRVAVRPAHRARSRPSSTTAPTWLVAAELATAAVVGRRPRRGRRRRRVLVRRRDGRRARAVPAADLCAKLNIQVHGGIGYHLGARRPPLPAPGHASWTSLLDCRSRAGDVTDLAAAACAAAPTVDLPPEAEAIRDEVRAFADAGQGLDADGASAHALDRDRLRRCRTGPSRGAATPARSSSSSSRRSSRPPGVKRPSYGITGWVILTLIQHATPDQVARWVRPALDQERHLVPALQRARRRLRRRRRQDQGDPGRRRLAGQRPEGLDQRRPPGRLRASPPCAPTPTCPSTQGITTMVIDMHAPGRRGAAAAR